MLADGGPRLQRHAVEKRGLAVHVLGPKDHIGMSLAPAAPDILPDDVGHIGVFMYHLLSSLYKIGPFNPLSY